MNRSSRARWVLRAFFWGALGAVLHALVYLIDCREGPVAAYWILAGATLAASGAWLSLDLRHTLRAEGRSLTIRLGDLVWVSLFVAAGAWLLYRHLDATLVLPRQEKALVVGRLAMRPWPFAGTMLLAGLTLGTARGHDSSRRWWWAFAWIGSRLFIASLVGAAFSLLLIIGIEQAGHASGLSPWYGMYLLIGGFTFAAWTAGLGVIAEGLYAASGGCWRKDCSAKISG